MFISILAPEERLCETNFFINHLEFSDCSLCIRRSICYKTQCPTCFVVSSKKCLIQNNIQFDSNFLNYFPSLYCMKSITMVYVDQTNIT